MNDTKQALEAVVGLVGKATDTPLIMEKFKEDDALLTFGHTGVLAGDFRYSLWCGIKEPDAYALAACWNLFRTHGPALLAALDQVAQLQAALGEAERDRERLDWLADRDNHIGNVQLPTACVELNLHSLRAAIDAAMALPIDAMAAGGVLCDPL